MDPSGRVVGMAEGSGVVRVTSGAASDSATVIVIAARRGWFTQTSDVAMVCCFHPLSQIHVSAR